MNDFKRNAIKVSVEKYFHVEEKDKDTETVIFYLKPKWLYKKELNLFDEVDEKIKTKYKRCLKKEQYWKKMKNEKLTPKLEKEYKEYKEIMKFMKDKYVNFDKKGYPLNYDNLNYWTSYDITATSQNLYLWKVIKNEMIDLLIKSKRLIESDRYQKSLTKNSEIPKSLLSKLNNMNLRYQKLHELSSDLALSLGRILKYVEMNDMYFQIDEQSNEEIKNIIISASKVMKEELKNSGILPILAINLIKDNDFEIPYKKL